MKALITTIDEGAAGKLRQRQQRAERQRQQRREQRPRRQADVRGTARDDPVERGIAAEHELKRGRAVGHGCSREMAVPAPFPYETGKRKMSKRGKTRQMGIGGGGKGRAINWLYRCHLREEIEVARLSSACVTCCWIEPRVAARRALVRGRRDAQRGAALRVPRRPPAARWCGSARRAWMRSPVLAPARAARRPRLSGVMCSTMVPNAVPAHARIGNAHHVLHALPGRASSGSACRRPPACPARPSGRRCAGPSPSSAVTSRFGSSMRLAMSSRPSNTTAGPLCGISFGVGGGLLDDRAARRHVAAHDRQRLAGRDRVAEGRMIFSST